MPRSSEKTAPARAPIANAGQAHITAVFLGAAAVVIGSAVLGIAANSLSPRGIPLFPAHRQADDTAAPALPQGMQGLDLPEVRAAFDERTALFLDARPSAEYEEAHIPGALSLPADEFDDRFGEVVDAIESADRVIVYCDGVECSDSIRVAERLLAFEFEHTFVFEAGWHAWLDSGAPVTQGAAP